MRICQQVLNPLKPLEEIAKGLKIPFIWQGNGIEPFDDGTRVSCEQPLHLENLLHVPLEGGWNADEPEGLACGGAIQNDDVENLLVNIPINLEEARDLLHAGHNGQFFS